MPSQLSEKKYVYVFSAEFFKQLSLLLAFLLIFFPFYLSSSKNISSSSRDSLWPSIEINSNGRIMIVWTEWETGDIYYREYKNGQWTIIKNSGIVHERAWSNQLAVDSQNTFHLSYADGYSSGSRDIFYSYFTGSGWSSEERIYASTHNSAWNRIDIDTNDRIHIIWYHSHVSKHADPSCDAVTMSKSRMGSWPSHFENISRTKNVVSIHPAIGVRNNNVYACWMEDEFPRLLYFSEKTDGSWSTPEQIERGAYYPDMLVDSSRNIHIVYSNRTGNFFYLCRINGQWRPKEIISNGFAKLQFGDINIKGDFIIAAWAQGQSGNYEIYSSAKPLNGTWIEPVNIGSAHGGNDGNKHVQVTIGNDNTAHYVWEAPSSGNKNDILYEKVDITDIEGPIIHVDKSYIEFKIDENSGNPGPKTFKVKNSGEDTLNYTIESNDSWVTVYPTEGSSTGEWDTITVEVDALNFGPGQHYGSLTIKDPEAYNSPFDVTVSLYIEELKGPYIQLNKNKLEFLAYARGKNPTNQHFKVRNSGSQTLHYEIKPDVNWIDVSPNKGHSTSEWDLIIVSVDISNKDLGFHRGEIKITSSNAENSPQSLKVRLKIERPPYPYKPRDVQLEKMNHEGLMLKIYKNVITWDKNPKNNGLFNIKRYFIYRRLKYIEDSPYEFRKEVDSSVFSYSENFTERNERNKYTYAVTCVDGAQRESMKAEASVVGERWK